MFSVIIIGVVLATTSAEKLNAETLEGFQSVFYGTIMKHLDAEYKLLQPAIAQQNRSMDNCKSQIVDAQEICKSCAERNCERDFGDWIALQWGGAANWFEVAGQSFVDWKAWQDLGGVFENIGKWFNGAGNSFVNWKGWGDMGNFFSDLGSNIGNTLGNGFSTFGNIMGNAFGGFGSWFARGRRDVGTLAISARRIGMIRKRYMAKRMQELSPEVRNCMEKCSECTAFLGNQKAMIGEVCGDKILLEEAAMGDVMRKMKALFDANGNPQEGKTPILISVEYDKSTFDFGTFTCGGVYVTAVTPNGEVRYPSSYRYNLQFPQTTATELALELLEKWNDNISD